MKTQTKASVESKRKTSEPTPQEQVSLRPARPAPPSRPAATSPAKPVPPAVKLEAAPLPNVVNANFPGKELGLKPIGAPLLPISATKEMQLEALLAAYQTDQITPEQYHTERAKILAAP
jgi:hypothetical protein